MGNGLFAASCRNRHSRYLPTEDNGRQLKLTVSLLPAFSSLCSFDFVYFLLHGNRFAAKNACPTEGRGKGGRSPKNDPANFRYSVNFTAVEHAQFLTLFEQSGLQSKARFIAARVFDDEFRVVETDRSAMEYVTKLTSFYAQFRSVGVNYNQVVKELHTHFSEKKALALLYKLEKATVELVETGKKIMELSEEFKANYSGK